MPTSLEERVAYLEGKVEEHSRAWEDLKDMIIHLDQKVDRRFEALDQKVDRFREEIDRKFSRYFLWTIGIQVTVLLAIIGLLINLIKV